MSDDNQAAKKPRLNTKPGLIESIEMLDFMCHKRLLLQLNPYVNFISGRNGSGKSACLTALTICLGNRASSTQRGSNLSELIREGCDEAIVRVIINNSHEFPFKLEIYGPNILIERKLVRSGSSKYHVFAINKSKKSLISDKKEEVILICDHFGIQVENPLSILTQETAKKFLSAASPRDLYKFFLKATQLDQMQNDFFYANEKINESKLKLDQEGKNLEYLEQMISDLKSKIESILEFQQIVHKKFELERELFWAQFRDLDQEQAAQDYQVSLAAKDLNNAKIQAEDFETRLGSVSSKICFFESEISSIHNKSLALREQKSKCLSSLQNEKLLLKRIQEESESMTREFQGLNEKIDLYRQRIKTNTQERDIEILKEKINNQMVLISDMSSKVISIAEKQKTLRENCQKSLELLTQMHPGYNKIENQLAKAHEDLRQAQNSLNNRLNFYGSWVPVVFDLIDRETFEKRPIGPIGFHINVKEFDKWSLVMSAVMGKDMKGFIVSNHKDRNRLQMIFHKLHLKNIPIFVINFEYNSSASLLRGELFPLDSNNNKRGILSALQILEIDNEIVRKALVILHGIEQIFLFEDREAAMDFLENNSQNIHSCFTRTARMSLNKKTGALTYINLYQTNEPFFVQGSEQRIKIIHDLINDLQPRKNELSKEISDLKRQNDSNNQSISTLIQKGLELENKMNEIRSKLKQDELELKNLQNDGGNFLERELMEIEDSSNNLKIQISANSRKQSELLSKVQQLDSKSNDLDNEQGSLQEKHKDLEIKLRDCIKLRQRGDHDKKQFENLILEKQEILSKESLKLENLSSKINDMKLEASINKGDRIVTDKSTTLISREILRQQVLCDELKNTDLNDINLLKHELSKMEDTMFEVKRQLTFNGNLENKLVDSLKDRSDITIKLREELAVKSNISFITLLCSRGFYGQLSYDFQNELLNLNITTENEDLSKTHDVRQLSGGERSFATACFLFALWNSMRCPLLALDEFDVFMDPVNRNLTLKLLIEHARQSKSQYILITPNALR